MSDKLIRDGKVAVIYSPTFGAGWSTWADDEYAEEICMDRELAEAILAGDKELAADIAKRKWPDQYQGGLAEAEITWVPQGSRFEIEEYDGNETVRVLGPDDGFVA